jgi:transposase
MSARLIVGVDPGRYGHGVVARTAEDAEVVRERVDNDSAAIDELVTRVVGLAGGGGQALWVIEADGGDGSVLIGELLARGELVATLTPTEVAVRRKGRRQVHKSDLIDAEVCARIGREEQASLRRLVAVPETVAEMRVLARYQDGLIRDRTRLINRLRFLLSQYWPEFLAARAFAALDGDAVTALLVAFPTPSALRTQSPLELASFLAGQRYRRRPLERAQQLLAAAQVGVRPQEPVYGRLVAEVAGELGALKQRIGALDAEIRDRFLSRPEALIVLSLPGMSHRTGPRFLAEVGTLERFGSHDALAAYAGLTPTLWQSGRSSGTHFLSRRCNLHLRQALWSAALGSLKTPASRRFYDRKRSEGKSHHQAIIALARTKLRVLWAMLRAGTLFMPERALEAA